MNIEGGGGIGVGIGAGPDSIGAGVGAVSAGPAGGAGFEAAPSLGGLKSFGPKFESLAYSPIDRRLGKGDFNNMTDYKFGMFNTRTVEAKIVPSVKENTISVAVDHGEAKAKAIWAELTDPKAEPVNAETFIRAFKAKEALRVSPALQPEPIWVPIIEPFQEPRTAPQKAQYMPLSTRRLQNRVAGARAVEQAIDTPKAVEETYPIKDESGAAGLKTGEDVTLEKRRIVRDGKAFYRRILDGLSAIKKAFSNVPEGKKVSGKDVEAYIPEEYFEVRSGALKQEGDNKTPDGGYELYRSGVRNIGEVSTPEEMAEKVEEQANENEPVIKVEGEIGEKPVNQEAVGKVYIHKSHIPPIEEVNIRISKKEVTISEPQIFEIPRSSRETSIQDHPDLAEVFRLAA